MASLLDPVRRWAAERPDSTAVRDTRGDLTYAGLLAAAQRFAGTLADRGVQPGDRVVLLAPSGPEFVVAYLGVQAAGAVVVPMNTMATAEEVRHVLVDAAAGVLVTSPGVGPAAPAAAAEVGVPAYQLLPALWAPHLRPAEVVPRGSTDTAAVLYTSGTTGRPKGAQLSVGNVLAAAAISVQISDGSPADRIGTGLPLFHVYGQVSVMMAALTAGCSLSLLTPFSPEAMVDMVCRDQLTVIAGVPTMWNSLLRLDTGAGAAALESVRLAVSGGAALPGPVADEFERRFGCELLEGYGLTETTSLGTFNRGGTRGAVGRPVPHTRVEARDPDGSVVPAGQVGELFVAGPSVMTGYWNRPEETAAALVDGWLRTGDLGRFTTAGELVIVDRLKDLVIRGGYNVYPAEVEEVLYAHPDVVEAAVVGIPDEHYGEEVAAVVVLRPGAELAAGDLTEWSRSRLSAYKIPRIVAFVDELPKGPSGKILKRAIDRTALR